jgi:hypothetical protein
MNHEMEVCTDLSDVIIDERWQGQAVHLNQVYGLSFASCAVLHGGYLSLVRGREPIKMF